MPAVARATRRRLLFLALAVFLNLSLTFYLLPLDSHARLAINFNTSRFINFLRQSTTNRDEWLDHDPAPFPLDLGTDVGYIVKTGYGTRQRVPAQLAAFSHGGILGKEGENFLVVGDWTMPNETDTHNLGVQVHDVIKAILETKIDKSLQDHPRFLKYKSLNEAIASGNENSATELGKSFGWELDALKFVMGMELAYKAMPHKKWYIILDDDSFLVESSLDIFLSHLNPARPYYIGNAVGDYKTRFAHGGSTVILSGEAMTQLFNRPDIVAKAYVNSLEETWGDRLVATTLMELGIYLEERYSHHFSGEPPEMSRITSDNFCSPILSFHGLREQGAMEAVGRVLARADDPVLWGDILSLFGQYPVQETGLEPVRQDHDYIGPRDDLVKTLKEANSAESCRSQCRGNCLAWTYDQETFNCHVSPWLTIGKPNVKGRESGLGSQMVQSLIRQCG